MSLPSCTLVCGVDRKHLEQLSITFPTWQKNKPSLMKMPMLVFYDQTQLDYVDIVSVVRHPDMDMVPWPPSGVQYEGDPNDKWTDPQRYKMLAGFIHCSAAHVGTHYWLKLDTDVVAHENDDWIDPDWFESEPAIISHPWGFTKPPDQMTRLDEWVLNNEVFPLSHHLPLNLRVEPGADRLKHPRIISWCSFYRSDFTRMVSYACRSVCGSGKLPVPSQDGVAWYFAARVGEPIVRPSMKNLGWSQWLTMKNIRKHSGEAMIDDRYIV